MTPDAVEWLYYELRGENGCHAFGHIRNRETSVAEIENRMKKWKLPKKGLGTKFNVLIKNENEDGVVVKEYEINILGQVDTV